MRQFFEIHFQLHGNDAHHRALALALEHEGFEHLLRRQAANLRHMHAAQIFFIHFIGFDFKCNARRLEQTHRIGDNRLFRHLSRLPFLPFNRTHDSESFRRMQPILR